MRNGFDPFPLVHFSDMAPRLDDGYIIKNLIGSGAMVVLYGESGSGKTFLALHLGLAVAGASEFFDRRVRQVGVVYIAAEAGRGIENRVVAAKLENALQWTADKIPFAAIMSPVDLCSPQSDTSKLVSTIMHADLGLPVGLVVIDTLSRVMAGGNENQPDDMGALVRNIDYLRAETGAAILLVHHTGKDLSRGARGHSLLRAATDAEIEVSHEIDSKRINVTITKQRDYATEGAFAFTLRRIELGEDDDGDVVTSCVVEPAEGDRWKKPKPPSGAAKLGLAQLNNCLAEQAIDLPSNSHIPLGFRGVTLEAWKNYLLAAAIINREGNPREQFRRIRVTLQSSGIIGVWDDFVWLSRPVT
jgi:energy-coupling factor transporter ATP-binding protein EcfA2